MNDNYVFETFFKEIYFVCDFEDRDGDGTITTHVREVGKGPHDDHLFLCYIWLLLIITINNFNFFFS